MPPLVLPAEPVDPEDPSTPEVPAVPVEPEPPEPLAPDMPDPLEPELPPDDVSEGLVLLDPPLDRLEPLDLPLPLVPVVSELPELELPLS